MTIKVMLKKIPFKHASLNLYDNFIIVFKEIFFKKGNLAHIVDKVACQVQKAGKEKGIY